MLTDKDMAMDALESKKAFISELTKAAMECSNPSLKNTIIQMRNRCEQSQQEIAQIAQSKGWYMPSVPADHSDIRRVQSFFNQPMQQMPSPHMGSQWQQQQQQPYGSPTRFQ
ncbi:spore coat protein [Desulfitibacter alkalitolerans]|uniref:spore coat protein n=1 Tax=Desulfitibacter alkalitolerans TaxID=264641 RepID=UPI00068683A2|nr:spore coat protein [Desulfitibacter alkalitolerans]